MENKKVSLETLKAKLKSNNVVANVQAIKGGLMNDCHTLQTDQFIGGQHITNLPKRFRY
jgi:hypothetical protein